MTLPGLWCIDRFGRRPVLLIGALGMGTCQFIVAIAGVATNTTQNYASALAQFVFLCIYVSFFASTFGPAAWVVTGELFELKTRAKCLSMTTAANWFFNWLLSFITPYLTTALNPTQSNVFWIWGSFAWIAVFFVWFFIYETKDMTLEQVGELYNNESRAWKSPGYRQQIRQASIAAHSERGYSVSDEKDAKPTRAQSIEHAA
jgi:SP family sugar:H+ symporter-like MFS transporter